jgi:hypothetical protein
MRIPLTTRRLALPAGVPALPVVLLAALLTSAPAASADPGTTIINRCTRGQSLSGFSQKAYHEALQELPTEIEEYSDCANLIRRAQLTAAGQGGSAGGEAPSATPLSLTASERGALTRVPKLGSAPLQVGNQLVRPGVVHADIASALSSLPDSLLAILAFMLACVLLLAARALRNRVRAHRPG